MPEPWTEGVLLAHCTRCKMRRPVYVREPVGLENYRTHAFCDACRTVTSHEWHRVNGHGDG